MGFLIRIALLIGIIILFIPADEAEMKKQAGGQSVSLFDTIGFATAAYSDASGFCTRNPQACSTGGVFLDTFEAKARTGARWLYAWLEPSKAAPAAQGETVPEAQPTPQGQAALPLRGPLATGSVRTSAPETPETMVSITPHPRNNGRHLPPPPPPRPS